MKLGKAVQGMSRISLSRRGTQCAKVACERGTLSPNAMYKQPTLGLSLSFPIPRWEIHGMAAMAARRVAYAVVAKQAIEYRFKRTREEARDPTKAESTTTFPLPSLTPRHGNTDPRNRATTSRAVQTKPIWWGSGPAHILDGRSPYTAASPCTPPPCAPG